MKEYAFVAWSFLDDASQNASENAPFRSLEPTDSLGYEEVVREMQEALQ